MIEQKVVAYNTSRTFSKKITAVNWGKKIVNELELDGAPKFIKKSKIKIRKMIFDYLNHPHIKIGRTKKYTLELLMGCEIAEIYITDFEAHDIIQHCSARIETGITKSTVNHDVSYLRSIFKIAKTLWRYDINDAAFEEALPTLHHLNLVGKSNRRTRRPTSVELEKLEAGLKKRESAGLSTIPFVDILNFSILSCMRISEVCKIQWEDLDRENKSVVVKDRKDPRKKSGNNMLVPLIGGAFELITKQPEKDERIFPYNSRSVTAGFQRVRDSLGIEDLRYHDLRREGASRLFEKGYAIDEVAQVTGHRNINTLWQVYTELFPNRLHDKGIS